MRSVTWAPLLLAGVVACGGNKGDSADDGGPVPDITGRYNVDVVGIAGCENDPAWVDTWARGRLDVSGAGADLVFDFGDDAVFDGTIEAGGDYRFSGTFDTNGATLVVSATGVAGLAETDPGDGSQSQLSGAFSIQVSQDGLEDCTVDAPFEATELVDFE